MTHSGCGVGGDLWAVQGCFLGELKVWSLLGMKVIMKAKVKAAELMGWGLGLFLQHVFFLMRWCEESWVDGMPG